MQPIQYEALNSRQKENYNFRKFAAKLADYGFNCLRLTDDWQGADFIACHIDGSTFRKVQLKGRLTIDRKYAGKDIWIAFRTGERYYFYPHDEVMTKILQLGAIGNTRSWLDAGGYSWPGLSGALAALMQEYGVG